MKYFITGIGTDVGKTVTAAIFTEALQADYWKPIQAGDLNFGDADRVKSYVSNSKTVFHPNAYALNTPASPHVAASIDAITIDIAKIRTPETPNNLIIEGAGGLLVPLNDKHCIVDIIQPDYEVVLVSRHYLGSINHTLLSFELLKQKGIKCKGIVFSGNENIGTESYILNYTNLPMLLRIEEEPYFDANVIKYYADRLLECLN